MNWLKISASLSVSEENMLFLWNVENMQNTRTLREIRNTREGKKAIDFE